MGSRLTFVLHRELVLMERYIVCRSMFSLQFNTRVGSTAVQTTQMVHRQQAHTFTSTSIDLEKDVNVSMQIRLDLDVDLYLTCHYQPVYTSFLYQSINICITFFIEPVYMLINVYYAVFKYVSP